MVVWQWNDGKVPDGGILKPVTSDMNVCSMQASHFSFSYFFNIHISKFLWNEK